MPSPIRPWPYAAKAVVQYEHTGTALQLWVIFRHPMDQTITPPLAKWIVTVNAVPKTPIVSVWLDAWTLTLIVINIPAHPTTVTVEYDGPDKDLRTTWRKQWEPWGPIDAGDVPFEWEHILEVDVPGERVTIHGQLLLSRTGLTAGTHNGVDVAGVNVVTISSSAGDVIIHGFANGGFNQIVFVIITTPTANDVTIKNFSGTGTQKIHLHSGADESLTNSYGGWVFWCDGTRWFDTSHEKHI